MAPKLPHAEPSEPPPIVATPPAGIISQPLSPILFNAETRAVRVDSNPDLRSAELTDVERNAAVETKSSVASDVSGSRRQLADVLPRNPIRLESRDVTPTTKVAAKSTELNPVLAEQIPGQSESQEGQPLASRRRTGAETDRTPKIANLNLVASAAPEGLDNAEGPEPPFAGVPPLDTLPVADPFAAIQPSVAPPLPLTEAEVENSLNLDAVQIAANSASKKKQVNLPDSSTQFVIPPTAVGEQATMEKRKPAEKNSDGLPPAAASSESKLAAGEVPSDFQPSVSDVPTDSQEPLENPSHASPAKLAANVVTFDDLDDEQFAAMFLLPNESAALEKSSPPCPTCGGDQCAGCEQLERLSLTESGQGTELSAQRMPSDLIAQMVQPKPAKDSSLPASSGDTEFVPPIPKLELMPTAPTTNPAGNSDFAMAQPIETEIKPAADANTAAFSPASHHEQLSKPEVASADWQYQLDQTIDVLKRELINQRDSRVRQTHEINLQVLQALKKSDEAADQKQPMSAQEQAYWQHQLDAISALVQNDESSEDSASNSLVHLRQAVERLEQVVGLRLANAAFCTAVQGFGQIQPFASTEFGPSERMLVYCEVENYQPTRISNSDGVRFVTKLRGSIVIRDEQGREVQTGDFPTVEDVALNKRRDFYMYFPVTLEKLPAGNYQLELQVEDLTAQRNATVKPAMSFKVR